MADLTAFNLCDSLSIGQTEEEKVNTQFLTRLSKPSKNNQDLKILNGKGSHPGGTVTRHIGI